MASATFTGDLIKKFHMVTKLYADVVGEGNMTFDADGISMTGMDPSHVCLLKTVIPGWVLRHDGIDGYNGPEEAIQAGIPYKILSKIIGSFSTAKSLQLKTDVDSDVVEVVFTTDDGDSRFVIKLMDIEDDGLIIPEMEYSVNADIPYKTLQKLISQAEILEADTIEFMCVEDSKALRAKYKTDSITADVIVHTSPEIGDDCDYDTVSLASTYPRRLFAAGQMSDNVKLSYSKDIPVRFRFEYGLDSDSGEYAFTELHVAPRVNDDFDDGDIGDIDDIDDDETNYRS